MADKAKLQFYPLDITYKLIDDKAALLIFGRTVKGDQVCVIDDKFDPYFWVILKDENDIDSFVKKVEKIKVEEKKYNAEVFRTEVKKKKFLGEEVKAVKVYCNLPKAVPVIREQIKEWDMVKSVNEYDVPFVRRYLIDKGIVPLTLTEAEVIGHTYKARVECFKAAKIEQVSTDSLEEPKILAFDIESYGGKGSIDFKKNPILMISFYGKGFKKVLTWKKFKTKLDYVEFVGGEDKLIERFKEIVDSFKPDILTGYFSDGFDLPYIKERADKYKIKMDIGLDYSNINFKKGVSEAISINGIAHVDIYKFVRRVVGRGLNTDSFTLDNVSKELLGESKKEVELKDIDEAWDKNHDDLGQFCEYNLQDSVLAYKLCEKLFPNLEELVKIVGLTPYDVSRMGFSQLVEWFILRQAPEFNEIAMNNPHSKEVRQRRTQTYTGAFVYEPKPGLYKDIALFDFRSLYPSIIVSHNIGPSTLNCDCCKGKVEYAPTDEKEYFFCKKKKGFLPSLLKDIIERRMRVKEIIKKNKKKNVLLDARSEALKLLANSFYGYLGFFGARWYSIECARSVTAYGRYYIHKTIDMAEKEGFKVLYGDTDSVFLSLEGKTEKDGIKLMEEVNEELPGVMELEYEGFYPSGIFVAAKMGASGAKKKYALLGKDDNIKVMGFELVRRNWSIIAKETQEEVLKIILRKKDNEKALKYVQKVIKQLKDKKIDNEKLIIRMQLTKDISEYEAKGPHVAVAERMKGKGIDVGPGMVIEYVITAGKGIIRERAKIPEELKKGEYDAAYYIEHQVIPAVERIFDVLGYSKEDLVEGGGQSKLGKFFK